MLFAIFLKSQNFFLHQLNSKNIGPDLLFKMIFWNWYSFVSRRLSVEKDCKDWNLGNNKIQDTQQPFKYETDSDNELKVTKKVTLKTFVAGNAWPGREDQYEITTGASGCTLIWLYDWI